MKLISTAFPSLITELYIQAPIDTDLDVVQVEYVLMG